MAFDPGTKTAAVRDAMEKGDWDLAIRLSAKLRTLGEHGAAIRRAKDAINNPNLYVQLGYDLDTVRNEGIAAIKDRFSRSWDSVKDKDTD
ncbi:MAG: hypothetical protein WDN50_19980 [Bradyrhizobium sp.]